MTIPNESGSVTQLAAQLSSGFPDEVVTRALVRDVDLGALGLAPGGTLALITLGQRQGPHPAVHVRPQWSGLAERGP